MRTLWTRIPILVRAAAIALAILAIGQLPPGVFLILGLKTTPRVPWFLPATIAWLLVFWSYLSRHAYLRATTLSPQTWLWSLLAGGLGMASVLSGALLTGRVASLPPQAYAAPLDLDSYPSWTVVAFFLNLALVAGVVEEAAFRGYMLSMVEQRHGWTIAIASAAILFYLVHLSHAYATPAFIPFFAAYSVLHGALVFFTRSIRPSVVLHALGDFTILPIQYGVVASPLGTSVRAHLVAVVLFAIGSIVVFRQLARVAREARPERAAYVFTL